MLYILPKKLFFSEEVVMAIGGEWTCPFCSSSSTRARGKLGPKWIHTPLRTKEPRYICDTCATEVYISCADYVFYASPGIPLLRRVSQQEGLSVLEIRKRCLEHQLELIRQRIQTEPLPVFRRFETELLELLSMELPAPSESGPSLK
jgi:hypothetical protein